MRLGKHQHGHRRRSYSCQKVRYPDDLSAKAALRTLRRAKEENPTYRYPVRAYRCPDCKGWHLSSIERWID